MENLREQVNAMVEAALQRILALQQEKREGDPEKQQEQEQERNQGELGKEQEKTVDKVREEGKEKEKRGGGREGIQAEQEAESHAESAHVTMVGELELLKQKILKLENTDSRESSRVKSSGCPFSPEIIKEPLPFQFKSAKIKGYDGSGDPEEHMARFENVAMLHCYNDQIKCKIFLTTLEDSAQRWFENLEDGSIDVFKKFREIFLQHFSSSKRYRKTTLSLFEVKQVGEESLRAYIKKFNKITLEIPACAPKTRITAFTQGLREGKFFRSLVKKTPRNFEDLLARAEKYINMEEAQKQKRDKDKREGNRERGNRNNSGGGKNDYLGRLMAHALPKVTRDRGVHVCEEEVRQTSQKGAGKYCSIHEVNTHDTSECRRHAPDAKRPVSGEERRMDKRQRGPYRAPGFATHRPNEAISEKAREVPPQRLEDRTRDGPSRGVINMISRGSTDGDSNRARKSWSKREVLGLEARKVTSCPVISFGPEDLKDVVTPHNDALLIQARVANYDIRRVFVDSGSSVNVIFQEAFEKMDLLGCEVNLVKTSLYGFAGHTVQPRGEVWLPITLGAGELRRTIMTLFSIVEAPSSYNVILGRPALNAFMAVASAYHQKIKFPVGNQIGEVKGDQPSSRRCYADTVRVDNKKARGEQGRGDPGKKEVCTIGEVKEEHEVVQLFPEQPGKIVKVARDLEVGLMNQLKACLAKNTDVFAWSSQELTGIPPQVAEHKLNILPGARVIKQKKRHFGADKDKVIADQVRELKEAGHIQEVQFPTWLSNVVLVPKATGKWRMCIDFRNLNEACPKDCCPLPRVDQLVDSTSGFELLSFMDAYQGYHQIPLAQEDQDKVSFITSGGTFCYVVMPFGLKNAGATYQRMMDKVFQGQLGRNVEVYVDDILVKSRAGRDFIPDLEETFNTL
ncbi:uncharacterized protein [Henckelia pumila]|uniref:uncharacterized protein n=1 Tax=Henckelia pumila TaxID=405737 RepID=UPI003C6E82CA